MESLYDRMIKEAKSYQSFKSMNRSDILDFPLYVPMGGDVITFLCDTFEKYYALLKHVQKLHDVNFSDIDVEKIKELGDKILEVHEYFRKGKIVDAYRCFEQYIDKCYTMLPTWKMEGGTYYQMRQEKDINRVSQMYPLPPELRYYSGGMRFSVSGYTCLYMGQSESVCKKEISDTGSMTCVRPKENKTFCLIDLTFSDDMRTGGQEEKKFIRLWPLIASCYIDQFYCLRGERLCPPDGIKFKESYIIPQFLTAYIRSKHDEIEGIRYYTVKDKNLDPYGRDEKDMRNIVLYVDSCSDKAYDDFIRKFEWGEPYNVEKES